MRVRLCSLWLGSPSGLEIWTLEICRAMTQESRGEGCQGLSAHMKGYVERKQMRACAACMEGSWGDSATGDAVILGKHVSCRRIPAQQCRMTPCRLPCAAHCKAWAQDQAAREASNAHQTK